MHQYIANYICSSTWRVLMQRIMLFTPWHLVVVTQFYVAIYVVWAIMVSDWCWTFEQTFNQAVNDLSICFFVLSCKTRMKQERHFFAQRIIGNILIIFVCINFYGWQLFNFSKHRRVHYFKFRHYAKMGIENVVVINHIDTFIHFFLIIYYVVFEYHKKGFN